MSSVILVVMNRGCGQNRINEKLGQDIHPHPPPKLNDNLVYLLFVHLWKF